jgi:hypothetical protein
MPKTMIFLFDGTANDAGAVRNDRLFARFSNVYAINQLIADRKKVHGNSVQTQVTFYLPGVGTKFTVKDPGFISKKLAYRADLIAIVSLLTMCLFLRKLGGVALDNAAHKTALAEIRSRIRDDQFVINPEPYLELQQKRDGLIGKDDEIHPLHWRLLKRKKEIIWKDQRKRYENRIGRLGKEERDLSELFSSWLSL